MIVHPLSALDEVIGPKWFKQAVNGLTNLCSGQHWQIVYQPRLANAGSRKQPARAIEFLKRNKGFGVDQLDIIN
jgi:hypothetical protein